MSKQTAVIVKGNPKFVINNSQADSFYTEIKKYLEDLGYNVSFDLGEPHSSPKKADLWVGHSRGNDRLRFAPEGTKTIFLGSSIKGAINHPQDNTKDAIGPSDTIPNNFHYVFTKEMKEAIKAIVEN
jgi:hypothetical protein